MIDGKWMEHGWNMDGTWMDSGWKMMEVEMWMPQHLCVLWLRRLFSKIGGVSKD
jgi:hypothetical protein